MAVDTTGLFATLATDLLNHVLPNAGTVATTVTVTGPNKIKLHTTASTNATPGTECADANYTAGGQPITWAAAATTAGAGSAAQVQINGSGTAGYVGKSNSAAINFPQGNTSTGFAAAATLEGYTIVSSDGTPVNIGYDNYAAVVNVPSGNVYQFAVGALNFHLS